MTAAYPQRQTVMLTRERYSVDQIEEAVLHLLAKLPPDKQAMVVARVKARVRDGGVA